MKANLPPSFQWRRWPGRRERRPWRRRPCSPTWTRSTRRRGPWRRSWSCAWSPWSSTGASSCSGTARYYLSVKNRLNIYLWIFKKLKLTNWSTVKCCLKWQCHDIVRQFFSPGPLTNSQKIVFLSVYLLCFAICLSPLFSPCLSPLFLSLCIPCFPTCIALAKELHTHHSKYKDDDAEDKGEVAQGPDGLPHDGDQAIQGRPGLGQLVHSHLDKDTMS